MKYSLFKICADHDDFNYNGDYNYDDVERCSYESMDSDDLISLFSRLILNFNIGDISDQDFLILGDTEERKIIYS